MSRVSVPAFSLIELLVVMVLSSIIVGIIYFSFSTITSYQLRLSDQKQFAEDAATFYFMLKKDVRQSTSVRATSPETILCERIAGNVTYSFLHNYVLRQQVERVDTFGLRFDRPVFSQLKKTLEVYPAVVDEIKLSPQADDAKTMRVSVYKYYDAAVQIKLTEKDSLQ